MSGGHAGGYSRYDFYVIDHQKRYRFHAIYWPDANAAPVELNPFNSPYSQVSAVSGNRQVGTASVLIGGTYFARAILWRGTAKSARDITMTGYDNSFASGLHGSQVVGQANGSATGGYVHAVVWDLKNSSIADLNGSDHQESGAVATNGTQQVGWATDPYGADDHAMLWSGTHDSQIDLHPSKFSLSFATAIDGQSQVGIGETLSSAHALLWHGSAASAVDLNPSGYLYSYATGVSGNKQVGYATKSDFEYHAMVWSSCEVCRPAGVPASVSHAVLCNKHRFVGKHRRLCDGIGWHTARHRLAAAEISLKSSGLHHRLRKRILETRANAKYSHDARSKFTRSSN